MAFLIWFLALVFLCLSTWLTLRRLRLKPIIAPHYPPVTILKPLKGLDAGLRQNLESFFQLDYAEYELLFSVAEARDPAADIVRRLLDLYPKVKARLIMGAENVGPNPKVNNISYPYECASHDLILISDSNVKVSPDYLKNMVGEMREGVGVVTAVVSGTNPQGLGGALEAAYLNSFYARGMNLAFAAGVPCVIGKSMMFRKSVADRFGGVNSLSGYIAEDYMLGDKMQKLGLSIALARQPIDQFVGRHSVSAFWQRHIRWGRIRKSHAPLGFLVEPLFTPAFSAAAGAFAFQDFVHPILFAFAHLGTWAVMDRTVSAKLTGVPCSWRAWGLREILALPLWICTGIGQTVDWRGTRIRLRSKGRIDIAWNAPNLVSSGEPLLARTKLKEIMNPAIGGAGN